MPNVIYSMGVSLDGFIADRRGEIDWSVPDEELHRFHNDQTGELRAHLLGRRLYEVMRYWDGVEEDQSLSDYEREFAVIWNALPKVVVSKTLDRVEGANTRLATGDAVEEASRLRDSAEGDVGVGGAGLAAALIPHGLVDEFRVFVHPVVLGGGTPYFPSLEERVDLELVETRTFPTRVVYLRYRRS